MALLVAGMLIGCALNSPNTTDLGYMLTEDELNKFLAVVLTRSYDDGGFNVVDPTTVASSFGPYPGFEKEMIEFMQSKLQIEGFDAKPLVDALHEVNRKSIRLTLPSDEAKGYVIDYDGRYDRYFDADGGGWEKLYEENPKAHGMITVSLPVYDREKGILLVYVITGTPVVYVSTGTPGWGSAGTVIAYQYRDGVLKRIFRESLWE